MLLLLLACAGGPADSADTTAAPWSPPDAPGPYAVATLDEELTSREGVPLTVQIWYPTTAPGGTYHYDDLLESPAAGDGGPADCAAPRPVVVFSHGNEGLRWQSFFLTERLASHGFVVIAPDHTYNTIFDADYDLMAEVILRRPWDVADSFDHLVARSGTGGDLLEGCVDPDAGYAVVGHSFGGYTAYAVAGGYLDVGAGLASCAQGGGWLCSELEEIAADAGADAIIDHTDPRAWAAVPMSPAAYELLAGALPSYTTPVTSLTGDQDDLTPLPEVQRIWDAVGGEKHLGVLAGASHYTFSDACAIVPTDVYCAGDIELELAHERIAEAVVARLRGQLGDEQAAQAFPPDDPEWTWQ